MTKAQQARLYGPAWRKCWLANWCKDADGRIVPLEGRAEPLGGLPTPTDVDDMAARIAARDGGVVTEAILRRAARYLALGRDIPSGTTLSNPDLDRVLDFFRLLSAPDTIAPVVAWENPDEARRKRLVHGLRNCGVPDAQLRAWCGYWHLEHGADWPSLPIDALQGFTRYVWAQRAKRKTSRSTPAAA